MEGWVLSLLDGKIPSCDCNGRSRSKFKAGTVIQVQIKKKRGEANCVKSCKMFPQHTLQRICKNRLAAHFIMMSLLVQCFLRYEQQSIVSMQSQQGRSKHIRRPGTLGGPSTFSPKQQTSKGGGNHQLERRYTESSFKSLFLTLTVAPLRRKLYSKLVGLQKALSPELC